VADVLSNDALQLVPRTSFDGPALTFDFPGLEIGVAEYEEGPTGCTVFHLPGGASVATDARGGSVGTVGAYEWVHAICLAGGSLYGLEAVAGVGAELLARQGYDVGWGAIALVSGAIVYDFGRRPGSSVYPDKALGRAALRAAASGRFPLGARGAGRSVSVGKTFGFERAEAGGQGGAFRQVGDTRLAVFTVVNSIGAVVDRDGTVVRGHLAEDGSRRSLEDELERRLLAGEPASVEAGANTTLTVVVTNARLERFSLVQLGRQVHASMARAIRPWHTLRDGDVLYAVSTNEVESLDGLTLGVLASELAWDAVLSAVATDGRAATPR
jgi:L-aminopeptidase/D-esterase-like protein